MAPREISPGFSERICDVERDLWPPPPMLQPLSGSSCQISNGGSISSGTANSEILMALICKGRLIGVLDGPSVGRLAEGNCAVCEPVAAAFVAALDG